MIASVDAVGYRGVLDAVRKDPNVDAIIAIFVSPIMIDAYEVARAIADAADGRKPVLSVFMGKQRSQEGIEELRRRNVPIYQFPEEAASAMSALVRYRALRDAKPGREVTFDVKRSRAKRVVAAVRKAGREELNAEEIGVLLESYGFPLAPSRSVASAAEAIAAAQDLGYPVVLKLDSQKISHKSDIGGVKVDLRNADEVGQAYRGMLSRLRRRDPRLRIVVQKMVRGGREVILGMTRDPQFGPLLMFGLGGVFVEVMRDVAVRIHPLTDVAAASMIRQIKGFPLLAGARGEKPVDLGFLETMLLRLSQLVSDLEDDLAELDLNPLIVTEKAADSFVVDARVSLRDRC
jgi:acetyltransferase